ncbi:hypothetical protein B4U79_17952 [Dinothrombium tinctorium]|uniref:DH domain-containing protein n=1 Tax=Dinothrombium tinctorium TaxID=1965070 RepID=A0A3S3SDK9_9ACAR|nr:hypothetical protein B4U79_17978 [Dinothrombium tinctorium]RWS13882.1 hypothetical protein B4U79_17952 [Dinothrombium tinctorium]
MRNVPLDPSTDLPPNASNHNLKTSEENCAFDDQASNECLTADAKGSSSTTASSAINMSRMSNDDCFDTVVVNSNGEDTKVDCISKLNYCHNPSESQPSYSSTSSLSSSSSLFSYNKSFRYNCKIEKEKKRPLSISSISSTSSSSCSSLSRNGSLGLSDVDKKSYLASIESLNDADACVDTDDEDESCLPSRSSPVQNTSESVLSSSESMKKTKTANAAKNNLSNSCLSVVKSKEEICSSSSSGSPGLHTSNTSSDEASSTKSSITCSPCKINQQLEHKDVPNFKNVPKYWDPNLSHIERVIIEIVETERTYVEDLRQIIEYLCILSHILEDIFKKSFNFYH